MALPLTPTQFKTNFAREFVYGSRPDQVQDADLDRAFNEATMVFNEGLWANTTSKQIAFGYAAAHFLVLNIQAAGGLGPSIGYGIQNKGGGAVSSKSVGSVSLSYSLPSSITENATLSGFLRTDFGIRYLQLLAPRLVGNGFVVDGSLRSQMGV